MGKFSTHKDLVVYLTCCFSHKNAKLLIMKTPQKQGRLPPALLLPVLVRTDLLPVSRDLAETGTRSCRKEGEKRRPRAQGNDLLHQTSLGASSLSPAVAPFTKSLSETNETILSAIYRGGPLTRTGPFPPFAREGQLITPPRGFAGPNMYRKNNKE